MNAETLRKISLENLSNKRNELLFNQLLPLLIDAAKKGKFSVELTGDDMVNATELIDYISSLGYNIQITNKRALISW